MWPLLRALLPQLEAVTRRRCHIYLTLTMDPSSPRHGQLPAANGCLAQLSQVANMSVCSEAVVTTEQFEVYNSGAWLPAGCICSIAAAACLALCYGVCAATS